MGKSSAQRVTWLGEVSAFVSWKSAALIRTWGVSLWRLACCAGIIVGGRVFIVYRTMGLRDNKAKWLWMAPISSGTFGFCGKRTKGSYSSLQFFPHSHTCCSLVVYWFEQICGEVFSKCFPRLAVTGHGYFCNTAMDRTFLLTMGKW